MLHSNFVLADEADDSWEDSIPDNLALWAEPSGDDDDLELFWDRLPTEQELMNMEADKSIGRVDDLQIRKERRTALRH